MGDDILETLKASFRPLSGVPGDFDPVMERVGDARIVLIGESTHGTREFYSARAAITERLIREKGFRAVAVEADWPDAYRVDRYVRLKSQDLDADAALQDFRRFPTWMWRNTEVARFVEWLRAFNETRSPESARVGFYGLDLYSLHASMAAVLRYLDKVDPAAASRARYRYSCFDHFGEATQGYGYAAAFNLEASCEGEVLEQLVELQRRAGELSSLDGPESREEYFFAEQNARLVRNAEEYYRAMFRGRELSWNLRDRHMADTLDALAQHLSRDGVAARIVVWAHNSHLGDARATEMGEQGELNVGRLVRERYGSGAVSFGLTTHEGMVTASHDWNEPAEFERVRPSLEGSYERLFHDAGVARGYLDLRHPPAREALMEPRLERAIGVIYRPQTERASHYFQARLPEQFDGLLHFDLTSALPPLENLAPEVDQETPETFPTGV